MRCLILLSALTASACAKEEPAASGFATATYKGDDRNALCIAGSAGAQRAGFVVYGADDANCSASGRIEQAGEGWLLIPAGDADCKIPFSASAGGRISLESGPSACAYYCGPGATYAGSSFRRFPDGKPATDHAGDPLC